MLGFGLERSSSTSSTVASVTVSVAKDDNESDFQLGDEVLGGRGTGKSGSDSCTVDGLVDENGV